MFSAILHGLCGFFIQILPCACFCLYPFWASFRYPRRRVLALLALIMAVMSAVFTYFYVSMDILSGNYDSYVLLNMIFLLTLALLLTVYLLCIRAQLLHKLFIFTLSASYGFLVTETVSCLCAFFPEGSAMYSKPVLVFHLLISSTLFYPMLNLLEHIRRSFQSRIQSSVWKGIVSIFGLYIFFLIVFYEVPMSAGIAKEHVLTIFSKAMEFMLLILCYAILRILETVQRQVYEYNSLKTTVESYKAMAETESKIREARHETSHHITALSILLRNQDYKGAENYLDKVARSNSRTPTVFYTPHILLNSILTEYKKRAEEAEIRTKYNILVPNLFSMDELDLCQFLSNLLDNSLEANLRLPAQKRALSLTIRQTGNFLYFHCENLCDPAQLHMSGGRPATSKSDSRSHGYGITIMERIAKKYNGAFRTVLHDGLFIAEANLCMPAKIQKEL